MLASRECKNSVSIRHKTAGKASQLKCMAINGFVSRQTAQLHRKSREKKQLDLTYNLFFLNSSCWTGKLYRCLAICNDLQNGQLDPTLPCFAELSCFSLLDFLGGFFIPWICCFTVSETTNEYSETRRRVRCL